MAGTWQVMFTPETFVAYAVDPNDPARVFGITDRTIYASDTGGCDWTAVLALADAPVSGGPLSPTDRFVGVAVLGGHGVLAFVSEAASRTRVVGSDSGDSGTWSARDSGLPPVGAGTAVATAPRADVAYVALGAPDASDAGGGSPLPLPTAPVPSGSGAPVLYRTRDGGRSWGRASGSVPGATKALQVDDRSPALLYALADDGRLWRSTDGAATFQSTSITGATAITALAGGGVMAFAPGSSFVSRDGGATFTRLSGPPEVVSAASRPDEPNVVAELSDHHLVVVSLRDGSARDVSPPGTLAASLRVTGGRVSGSSTFHALSGPLLLRYVDGGASSPTVVAPPGSRGPATITPSAVKLDLADTRPQTVQYELALPRSPSPMDVFYLVDITGDHPDLRDGIGQIGDALRRTGVDVRVGLGLVGSRPSHLDRRDPPADPTYRDPQQPGRPYRQPRLYRLARRLGPSDAAFATMARTELLPETYSHLVNNESNDEYDILRRRGQLIGLDQLMTGSGVHDSVCDANGRCNHLATWAVDPGQVAGWRPGPNVRRVIVLATPGEFEHLAPPDTPDRGVVERRLVDDGVRVIGMSFAARTWIDLAQIAGATNGRAGPGGLDCRSTPDVGPGQPIVCGSDGDTPQTLLGMLLAIPDIQRVALMPTGQAGLVRSISAPALTAVDVTADRHLSFTVSYGCAGMPPGTYRTTVVAQLRGASVATTAAEVTCHAPAAAPSPPAPPVPASAPAAPNPQLPPPAPAAPTPAQVLQTHVQAQVDFQAALRQQHQLQVAIASADADDAVPAARPSHLAMRRRDDERHATTSLLLSSAVACGMAVAAERRRRARSRAAIRLVR